MTLPNLQVAQVTLLTLQVAQVTLLTLQVTLGVMLLKLLHLENFCPRLRKASTLEANVMFMFFSLFKQFYRFVDSILGHR